MLYISTTFLKDLTPISRGLEVCKNNQINSIEIGSNHIYEKNVHRLFGKYKFNYIVHNYFPVPKKNLVVNIASLNENILKQSLKQIYSSINFCNKIGAKLYTFHPGFINDPVVNYNKKNYDFSWNVKKINNFLYNKAVDKMYFSLEKIINYSKKNNVTIALETEGSYYNHHNLLLQKPFEFEELSKRFKHNDIKINLNLGHLNLSSKKFKFDPYDFTKKISRYLVAFEMSHNNGRIDEHKPLKSNSWYWKLILDKKYNKCFKILELRNTNIPTLNKNIILIKKKINEGKSNKKNYI